MELHIEQGRALADLDAALGIAEGIWPHGRWRLDFAGQADHAGTAALADRRDPMIPYAATVLAARQAAIERGARATIGKVTAEPGAANAVCSAVRAWLDVRAPDGRTLEDTVDQILAVAGQESAANRVEMSPARSRSAPRSSSTRAGWPAGGGAGGARHRGAGTADRSRARRGGAGRPAAHRDAVCPQPHRGVTFTGRARRGRGLCGRGHRARGRAAGPGRLMTRPGGRPARTGGPPGGGGRARRRRPGPGSAAGTPSWPGWARVTSGPGC